MTISTGNFFMHDVAFMYLKTKKHKKWSDIKLCELGNQAVALSGFTFKPRPTGKDILSSRGVEHVSIDLNGLDGALVLDLSKSIPNLANQFDIVTNYGTTEHVYDQYAVFKNIHDFTKVGGVMVHSLPMKGYWRGHSPYLYAKKFPNILAVANDYKLILAEVQPRGRNFLLNCILRKENNNPFQKKNTFGDGVIKTKQFKKNTDNL